MLSYMSLNMQRQILTSQNDGSYATGPTLVNYRFNYEAQEETQVSIFMIVFIVLFCTCLG